VKNEDDYYDLSMIVNTVDLHWVIYVSCFQIRESCSI